VRIKFISFKVNKNLNKMFEKLKPSDRTINELGMLKKTLRRTFSGIMLTLLTISTLMLAFNVQQFEAEAITVPEHFPISRATTNAASPEKTNKTTNLRLLLNFYYRGELFWGAFSRSDFESYFEYVGYYNTVAEFDSWKAFDVICTCFSLDYWCATLQPEDVDAFRSFLSHGGGLVILKDIDIGVSDPALKQIDPALSNDGRTYHVLGGVVVTGVPCGLAINGVFNDNFIAFLDAVRTAGINRVGNRSIEPKEYYGVDVVLRGKRIDMVVEESRASEYEKDIPELERAMSNMEEFLNFTIDRRIKVSVRPMALEFGIFASGVTNGYDHIAHARPPGQVRGIFEHECGHIYEFEFNKRYFYIPGFGVGIIQTAASDNPGFSFARGELKSPRAIWILCALINMVGLPKMKVFYNSLNQYNKEFVPDEFYWNALYAYPEDETEFLRRSSSIINFYFSRAFGQNFIETIREWGINEVSDWEPVWLKLNETEQIFLRRYPLNSILLKRSDMYKAFYGGDFKTALSLAIELLDLFSDSSPPTTTHDYDGLWHNTDFTITLNATDNLSGVAETFYRINDGQVRNVSANGQPVITLESANNILEYWSVDNAGNKELPHNILTGIKLDKTPPTSSINLSGTSGNKEWFISDVNVSILTNDAFSGVDKIEYSFNYTTWIEYVAPFNITDEGLTSIYYRSIDKAGNAETAKTAIIKIDKTAPTIGIPSRIPEGSIEPDQEVKVLVNVTDSLSGIKNVTLSYNLNDNPIWIDSPMTLNSTTRLYETTIPGQPAGNLVKYKITAYDNAGNMAVKDNAGQYYTYTIRLAPKPAEFRVTDLSISPKEAQVGEKVTISVKVTNIGEQTSSYRIELKVADIVVDTKIVTLAGGQSTTVVFEWTGKEAGSYDVDVAGLKGEAKVVPVPPVLWTLYAEVVVTIIAVVAVTIVIRKLRILLK
jgi:hypothetical protein